MSNINYRLPKMYNVEVCIKELAKRGVDVSGMKGNILEEKIFVSDFRNIQNDKFFMR